MRGFAPAPARVPVLQVLVASFFLVSACAGTGEGPHSLTDWMDTSRASGCDLVYEIWEVPWNQPASDALGSPQDVLLEFGDEFLVEADWEAHAVMEIPEVIQISRWAAYLDHHVLLPPLLAKAPDGTEPCKDLLVVPLSVTAWSIDGQVFLVDTGGRSQRDTWKGTTYAPWTGFEHSVLVATADGTSISLVVRPDREVAEDRMAMSEGLWNKGMAASGITLDPEKEWLYGIVLGMAGGGDVGWLGVDLSAREVGGGEFRWGLSDGTYRGVQP